MLRISIIVTLAACVSYDPPGVARPAADVTQPVGIGCHLAAPYTGALTWHAQPLAELECTAVNDSAEAKELCAWPYVGVRTTGAVRGAHGVSCSDELAPYESQTFKVPLDFPRSACNADAQGNGGCIVHVFHDAHAAAAEIVEFAAALQASAPAPGRDQPTVAECKALLEGWRHGAQFAHIRARFADDNDAILSCLELPRVTLACLEVATDDAAIGRCAPR